MAFYNGCLTLSSEQFLAIPNPCGFKVATFAQGSTEIVKYLFESLDKVKFSVRLTGNSL